MFTVRERGGIRREPVHVTSKGCMFVGWVGEPHPSLPQQTGEGVRGVPEQAL